jgi:uncharacterized OsmC-like protein
VEGVTPLELYRTAGSIRRTVQVAACTAITLRMYAERKSWPLTGVDVKVTYIVKDRNTGGSTA